MKSFCANHFFLPFFFIAVVGCSTETQVSDGPFLELLTAETTGIHFSNTITESDKFNHFYWNSIYNGAGLAVGDIDNDELPDVFYAGNMVADRLYRNKGNFEFEDISVAAGLKQDGRWSQGVTMADINQDGWLDIYVTRTSISIDPELRRNLLYINQGNGSFQEMAKEYGLDNAGCSIQATFFDFDKDGDLDLYLVNQPLDGRVIHKVMQGEEPNNPFYSDRLYRNDGNEHFSDISEQAGISNFSYGLNAVAADVNGDDWTDIYVPNDYDMPDHLYLNNGDGTFTEKAKEAFKHVSFYAMGSDIGDINNDGLPDIGTVDMAAEDHFRSKTNMGSMSNTEFWRQVNEGKHFQYMFNTLHLNNGNGTFRDIGLYAGMSKTDWSWALLMADLDNDGWKDILITNGIKRDIRNNDFLLHIREMNRQGVNQFLPMELLKIIPSNPVPNYIYRNNGDYTFSNVAKEWNFDQPGFSNGIAYCDLDNDGDLDVITNNVDAPASVYRNNQGRYNNYLRLKIYDSPNQYSYNAQITITANGKQQVLETTATRGYLSAVEPFAHFGLGKEEIVEEVKVEWLDGKITVLKNVKANQTLKVNKWEVEFVPSESSKSVASSTYFKEKTEELGIDFQQQENEFDDFEREILLPHKQSQNGPYISTGDVNNDGLEDFFIGGATGYSGALYLQQPDGKFSQTEMPAFESDKAHEDLGSLFFDADGDQDLDLYVVSGGSEYEEGSRFYQDRLYLNDGKGVFAKSASSLPQLNASGQCVVSCDFDSDGDQDLFVGGRIVPGKYPSPAISYLLQNEGGKFKNVAAELAPELEQIGLVTDALFSDYDNDGDNDLIVVGEWMPISVFKNENGKFTNTTEMAGLADETGWWWSVAEGDFDGDGDMDYVAGNLGKNIKFKASPEKPFMVFENDFDANGTNDVVLASYSKDEILPVRGRECSSQQMPFIAEKFPTYQGFASATLQDIYTSEALNNSLKYEARTFYSSYIENNGDGTFTVTHLPAEAQFAPLRGMVVLDVNADGYLDIVGAGNLYQAEVETIRYDAGIGMCLLGDGKGGFRSVSLADSGFFANGDVHDVASLTIGDQTAILAGNNAGYLQVFIANNNKMAN